MERLLNYSWPGNVRKLRNAIEYAFILCPSGKIDVQHLPSKIAPASNVFEPTVETSRVDQLERKKLIRILKPVKGNQSEAARLMRVSRVTVWKKIKKSGINLSTDVR